ncbi:MAG: ADP-glyceromanno-heptose 6-epimerase [Gammaproteobacteria bacterium RIFCSPLOWO2_01_FULL_47_190]|nr:MAG: ADP-glyceromanno-heptose 6-epimerase [Gammaproteobacteria bacterium RIFCSPLOWO2_01_FULL_47_190]
MIIVTGGAGFIGSNLVLGLNTIGRDDILVIDDLTDGTKFRNLVDCRIMDYWDIEQLTTALLKKESFREKVDMVFHQGACSTTTEWNGRYMMQNNYEYSKQLLHFCLENTIPFIYASSGSVYGVNEKFKEVERNESPVNVYGYSKYLFDSYVRRIAKNTNSQVVGLRYFNVYGPREAHKQSMASVIYHLNRQLLSSGEVKIFRGSGHYADGEQRRDFIHVDDVVAVNLWFLQQPGAPGIYNVGTGKSRSFNEIARTVIKWHGKGKIEYIDFPENLKNSYQNFTEADIGSLRNAGYQQGFKTLEEGINQYLNWLNN